MISKILVILVLDLNIILIFTCQFEDTPTLLVHRDLIDILFNKTSNKNQRELMKHLTNQEKKSDELERKIMDRACSIYIKNKKKYFFTGIIDGVESFGVFIKAIELPFSGLARFNYFLNMEIILTLS